MNSQPTEPPPRRSFLGARKRAARDVQAADGWPTDFVSPGHGHADGWDYPEPAARPDLPAAPPGADHPGAPAYADPYAPGVYTGFPAPAAQAAPDYQGPPGYPAFADRGGLPLSDYSSMPDYPAPPAPTPGEGRLYPPSTPAQEQPAGRGPFVPALSPAAGPAPGTGPIPALDAWGQGAVAHDEYTHEEYAYAAGGYGTPARPGDGDPPGGAYGGGGYGAGAYDAISYDAISDDDGSDPRGFAPDAGAVDAGDPDADELSAYAGEDPGAGHEPTAGNAGEAAYVLSDVTRMPTPEAGEDEPARWAVLAYLTVPFFGPVLPLVAYLLSLRRSRWLRAHASQALNVWLTVLLYEVSAVIIGGMLFLDSAQAAIEVMGPLVVALWLVALFYLIRAAWSASRGGEFSFPRWLCSRMVR